MSSRIIKKDGRTLLFEDYGLSEVVKSRKALFYLENFLQEPTFKNITAFPGSGMVAGIILSSLINDLDFSSFLIFAFVGAMTGLIVMFSILTVLSFFPHDSFLKNCIRPQTKQEQYVFTLLKDNLLTTDEVFEFYDSNLSALKVAHELEYVNNLLRNTNSDSPIYKDLEKKRAGIAKKLEVANEYCDSVSLKIQARVKSKQKTQQEKEALEYLSAS